MQTIAFVTSEQMPDLNPREVETAAGLKERGFQVVPYVWSREDHEARTYDAIVIRSPWDYYRRLDEFLPWIDRLPERNVFNPKHILKWNIDKRYLRELETRGIPVVPTLWVEGVDEANLVQSIAQGFTKWGGETLVVKPVRSAGAFKTIRVSRGSVPDLSPYRGLDVMVQPMMEEILTEGEWSILYFGGEYSHTVLKIPKTGDFRVQYTHGGMERWVEAPQGARDFSERVLASVGETLLYARVDFVRKNGQCLLMELEVLEPNLFLDIDPEAPARFARALKQMLSRA